MAAALSGLSHSSGRKAITALLKHKSFKTSFKAPSAGSVSVTWTTLVTTGKGKHKQRKTVTVAGGSWHTPVAGGISVTIHLTAAGKGLLRAKPHDLAITALERFEPSGGSWEVLTAHFRL